MRLRYRIERLGTLGGLLGSTIMTVGLILAAIAFLGLMGQTYNPLNHFVSELGHTEASELWSVFSAVVIVGAIGFGMQMIAVGNRFGGVVFWLFALGGIVVAISGGLVAVFPMNVNLEAHGQVALTFFASSFLVVALFSLVVGFSNQTVYRHWLAIVGVPMLVSSLVFAVTLSNRATTNASVIQALATPENTRAAFNIVTASEWAVMISLLLWVLVVAVYHVLHPIGTLNPFRGITGLPAFLREG